MTGTARKAVAEALATLLFVFSIIGAINSAKAFTPLVIGFTLMVLIYATGHISGAHLNPAVSLAAWVRGALNASEFAAYVIAQLVGGALGAVLAMALWTPAATPAAIEAGPAFLAETLGTLMLAWVVLNVATSKDHPNNSFYGLAIGSTVFVAASTLGGFSGGGFNPAVALGLAINGNFDWANMWLYVLAPLVGGAIAGGLFRVINADDKLPAES